MLALVPLLVPAATAAATCILMLLLLMAINEWWLPQQPDSGTPRFHYFTRFVKWSKRKLSDALIAARKKLTSALGNAVARRSHALVLALTNMAELTARVGDTLAAEAEQTYRALYALRHVTLPNYVEGYVRPVITTANTALATAQAAATTLTQVSTEIADGLRGLPWGVPIGLPARVRNLMAAINHLWDQFFDVAQPRLNTLWNTTVPDILRRLDALERGAAGAGAGGLNAIRARLSALEAWRDNIVGPQLASLQSAIDFLSDQVFGPVEGGLVELLGRVAALELALGELSTEAIGELLVRVEEIERALREDVERRLRALELGFETITEELLGEVAADFRIILDRIAGLETQIGSIILPRLEAIEAALQPAALAAALLAALRIAAPNLFCRNVTRTTEALCRADEGWLDDLLALGLPILVLADLCAFARLTQAAAGGAVDLFSGLLLGAGRALECGGDGPPNLPLNVTALPDTAAAVAL